jgi:hypothetical protein
MLRSRLLLLKQDQIAILEEKLKQIDESEPCPLFLGKSRIDNNQSRKSVLADVDARLAEYGSYALYPVASNAHVG